MAAKTAFQKKASMSRLASSLLLACCGRSEPCVLPAVARLPYCLLAHESRAYCCPLSHGSRAY